MGRKHQVYKDRTAYFGPMRTIEVGRIPMYSYERPAWILWDALCDRLIENGWSEVRAVKYLQSRDVRSALDGDMGELIRQLGRDYADRINGAKGE